MRAVDGQARGSTFSASTNGLINRSLDGVLQRFAIRRLEEAYPYVILDARYEKVRLDGVIRSPAVLLAIGINWEGRRQLLSVDSPTANPAGRRLSKASRRGGCPAR